MNTAHRWLFGAATALVFAGSSLALPLPVKAQFGGGATIIVGDTANAPNWIAELAQWAKQIQAMTDQLNNAEQQLTQAKDQVTQGVSQLAQIRGQWSNIPQQLSGITANGGMLQRARSDSQAQVLVGEIGASAGANEEYLNQLAAMANRVQGTTGAMQLNNMLQSATAAELERMNLLQAANDASASADTANAAAMVTGIGNAEDPTTQGWSP